MRISGSYAAALVAFAAIGCRVVDDPETGPVTTANPDPPIHNDVPERAQDLSAPPTILENAFIGSWSNEHGGTRPWYVEFREDNTITFKGDGMTAHGTYTVDGRVATATWTSKTGGEQYPATEFVIGENGNRLSFPKRDNALMFEELTRD